MLSTDRSWTKFNFTDMHEVTSELIHPTILHIPVVLQSGVRSQPARTVSLLVQTH